MVSNHHIYFRSYVKLMKIRILSIIPLVKPAVEWCLVGECACSVFTTLIKNKKFYIL